MSTIIASNLATSTTKEQTQKFFEFCGKISKIEDVSKSSSTSKEFKITFVDPDAISTAILLDDAELNGNRVKITTIENNEPPSYSSTNPIISKEEDQSPGTPNEHDDIKQELKPKAAIFAEYLSQGYVLSDPLLQKAIDYDTKNGYSEKFRKFLEDVDSKYKVQSKSEELDQKLGISKYINKALQTGVGSEIETFYHGLVNDTKQINDEALRLAELKKKQKLQAESLSAFGTGKTADTSGFDEKK